MAKRNRYRIMEYNMTRVLIADAVVFLLYLLFAGFGVIVMKVITAIVAILASLLCPGFLYLSQELLRKRSLWMSTGFAAILLCTLVSLIVNFPSPAK